VDAYDAIFRNYEYNVLYFNMSMMGMAMSPMEGQMTGTDSGSTTDGSEGNNQEGGDIGGSGNEGDVVDTGGDFGGFDGGGFGDF
jgi:hypothetical protein